MRKIRVAHIITKLSMGGAQENTVYTYLHHDRSKYEAFLLSGGDDGYGGQRYAKMLEKDENVILIRNLSNSFNLMKDIVTVLQIYRFIKKNGIDIVHTHSSKAGVLGRIAAKASGASVIVHTVHGWSFHEKMKTSRKKFYVILERLSAGLCDKLIAVTAKDVEKGMRERIGHRDMYITIRSGIDLTGFSSYDVEKARQLRSFYGSMRIVGTIGRIAEQKNMFDFVEIARLLLAKRQDLCFLIVGDGPEGKKLLELIKGYGLEEHVRLLGTRNDISELLHVFDVMVLTSLWEGLPRVIPEAMYCGVPVVANNVDGVAEIIENGINGFATRPHDLASACRDIETLLEDTEARELMVRNAQRTITSEYDARVMVSNIEQLYEDILKRKGFGENDLINTK